MDDKTAITNVRRLLEIPSRVCLLPLHVTFRPETPPLRANVVLVIMKACRVNGWSIFRTGGTYSQSRQSCTPLPVFWKYLFLWIHTFTGLLGIVRLSLTSAPAPLTLPSFRNIQAARTLKENGYQTIYLRPMMNFLTISAVSWSRTGSNRSSARKISFRKSANTLGVPDDYMFEYSILCWISFMRRNAISFRFMTASLHEPYIIPKDCPSNEIKGCDKPGSGIPDWSIEGFWKWLRASMVWQYIFVFIEIMSICPGGMYDMQLSMQHTPCYFRPKLVPRGMQPDGRTDWCIPTIMGILRLRYLNNTMDDC